MRLFGIMLSILAIFIGTSFQTPNQEKVLAQDDADDHDVLIYTINQGTETKSLLMYDPMTDATSTLFTSDHIIWFSVSVNGDVAFVSLDGVDNQIYVLNIHSPEESLFNLSDKLGFAGIPEGWSLDGRYLALASHKLQEDTNISVLYVWDILTENVINITPDDLPAAPENYDLSWGYGTKLALTAWFGFRGDSLSPEIYVWDGNTTFNLSQNPEGEDRSPVWNSDGEIAFLSTRTGEYDILVWDGVSMKDKLPDAESFDNIAPEVTQYFSVPTWTSDGRIALEGIYPEDSYVQVYLWDGQTAINMSQNLYAHSGGAVWSNTGYWAFTTFFSSEQLIYVRDLENYTVATYDGYRGAWSTDGKLIWCIYRRPPARLDGGIFMWNEYNITHIVPGWEIRAQWQKSGQDVFCTSG